MSNITMLLLLLLGTLTFTSASHQQGDLSIMNAITTAPKPTAKPYLRPDLLRRDSQVLMAPDYTCGYVDGRAGALVTCENYGNCVVSNGALGCCPGGLEAKCEYQNVCIDYVAFYTSSACPQGCQMDPNTLKCTHQNWGYCIPHTFPDLSAIYYTCEGSIIGTLTVATNPNGQQPPRVWNTLLDDSLSSGTQSSTGASAAGSSLTRSTASSGGVGSTSSSSTSTASNDFLGTTDGLSTRTIIGIAVGGFLLICGLVGAGVWLCLRRRRSHQISYRPPQGTYQYGPPPPLPPPAFVPASYPPAGPVPKPWDGRPNPGYGGPMGNPQSHSHVTSPVSPVASPPLPPSRYELNSPPPYRLRATSSTRRPGSLIIMLSYRQEGNSHSPIGIAKYSARIALARRL